MSPSEHSKITLTNLLHPPSNEDFKLLNPPSEEDLHRDMPCKFSCCRNLPLGHLEEDDEDLNINFAHHGFSVLIDDNDMRDCFLNLPEVNNNNPFVLDYVTIADAQSRDAELQQKLQILAHNANLICYVAEPNKPWRICIPTEMLQSIVKWYHQVLNHQGSNRLYDTIAQHFYHKELKITCEQIVTHCDACQKYKTQNKGYGKLPEKQPQVAPFHEVAVDCIGPWKIKIANEYHIFNALTIIDTVTNLCEIARLDQANPSAQHVASKFEEYWLSRYPRPITCIYDQGKEFVGYNFQVLLQRYGIKKSPTSVKNP